jgi:hypothetical protein
MCIYHAIIIFESFYSILKTSRYFLILFLTILHSILLTFLYWIVSITFLIQLILHESHDLILSSHWKTIPNLYTHHYQPKVQNTIIANKPNIFIRVYHRNTYVTNVKYPLDKPILFLFLTNIYFGYLSKRLCSK